jgi:hypothetical protein
MRCDVNNPDRYYCYDARVSATRGRAFSPKRPTARPLSLSYVAHHSYVLLCYIRQIRRFANRLSAYKLGDLRSFGQYYRR